MGPVSDVCDLSETKYHYLDRLSTESWKGRSVEERHRFPMAAPLRGFAWFDSRPFRIESGAFYPM